MRKFTRSALVSLAIATLALTSCGRAQETPAGGGGTARPGFESGSLIGVALPQKTSENWVLAEGL
ncbi:sugar ABC transporter substrate-binding protein, partial [Arthrobacter deserti]|nr:sugar ABC transporter substrate-binding protein [Arthrobacter deserti]